MKIKQTVTKKQNLAVKDLTTRKNPKGGGGVSVDSTAEEQRKHNYKGVVTLVK